MTLRSKRNRTRRSAFSFLLWVALSVGVEASDVERVTLRTPIDTAYCVDKEFIPILEGKIRELTQAIKAARASGRYVGYLSIPLSGTGGGDRKINTAVSKSVKDHLEKRYGGKLWILAPGTVEASIPQVNGKSPGGPEYLYMWTQVLAGPDGLGSDFELYYFAGLADFWRSLGLDESNAVVRFEQLADNAGLSGERKRDFVGYYLFRAAASSSNGAHDEWNILRSLNGARRSHRDYGPARQIASFFDGRLVEIDDMESGVSVGYEGACRE